MCKQRLYCARNTLSTTMHSHLHLQLSYRSGQVSLALWFSKGLGDKTGIRAGLYFFPLVFWVLLHFYHCGVVYRSVT